MFLRTPDELLQNDARHLFRNLTLDELALTLLFKNVNAFCNMCNHITKMYKKHNIHNVLMKIDIGHVFRNGWVFRV